jgi:hypothetical protein
LPLFIKMIIYKGQNNKIGVTLKEKQTLTLSDFVFKFTNDMTGKSVTCTSQDVSLYPDRINIFYIAENNTPDPINAVVSLNPSGMWTYEIYEVPQASPKILDISQSVAILETGILIVKDIESSVNTFNTDEDKNNSTFNG